MNKAEKAGILAWMDKQIELYQTLKSAERYSKEISAINNKYDHRIHIGEGIKQIAEATGTDVMWQKETRHRNSQFYVSYKDYTFFELADEEEEGLCI